VGLVREECAFAVEAVAFLAINAIMLIELAISHRLNLISEDCTRTVAIANPCLNRTPIGHDPDDGAGTSYLDKLL
jgi:hypothetical protein